MEQEVGKRDLSPLPGEMAEQKQTPRLMEEPLRSGQCVYMYHQLFEFGWNLNGWDRLLLPHAMLGTAPHSFQRGRKHPLLL